MVCKPLQKLDDMRRERGESLAMLEKAVGISDSTLGRWFSGKGEPSYAEMELLASHYGTTVEALCHEETSAELMERHTEQARQFFAETFRSLHHSDQSQMESLIAHHEAMLEAQAGLHRQMLDQQQRHYNSVVCYLKNQVSEFRITAIIFLVLFILSLCFIIFITVADIPEMGAGGTIAPNGATPLGFVRLVTIPLMILLLAAVTVLLIVSRKRPPQPPQDPQ